MKQCKKCGQNFPLTALVDGVRQKYYGRKYCLTCSPAGSKNSKKLCNYNNNSKLCSKCARWKDVSEFYFLRKRNLHSAYCKECHKGYVQDKRLKLKIEAINYKGNKCLDCSQQFIHQVYDFHHLDPAKKDFTVAELLDRLSWDEIKTELDKCVLLCANCHRIRHTILH